MEYEGKLCFATSNQKPIYAQLKANPSVEICAASKDLQWLRLSGKALFCTTKQNKAKALEILPLRKKMYSVEDVIFEVFYIENAVANFSSMAGGSKTLTLKSKYIITINGYPYKESTPILVRDSL